jgi:hypothetical protein
VSSTLIANCSSVLQRINDPDTKDRDPYRESSMSVLDICAAKSDMRMLAMQMDMKILSSAVLRGLIGSTVSKCVGESVTTR